MTNQHPLTDEIMYDLHMDESVISQIRRGEMVEIPQGEDEPSKFLYKDLGGHTYWVSLMPYKKENTDD